MGPNMVNRENGQRRTYVSANVAGRDLVGAVEEARQKIAASVELPTGYFISYGGQFESQASASRLLLLLGLASFTGMFLVLYLQFRSVPLALQVMLNIPLAFIGSVIGVWFFSDRTVSIASMVGFIALRRTVEVRFPRPGSRCHADPCPTRLLPPAVDRALIGL